MNEFKIIKQGDFTEYSVKFQVNDEDILFYTPTGDLTERVDQVFSGWSFQDNTANEEFSVFLEEIGSLDLIELTEDMKIDEIINLKHIDIVREG